MRQSQLFSKTRKDAPKDEVAKNAQLLIRAGYIHKEMAGVYAFLPLGVRVLNKIIAIVREEMNALGAQEIIMTTLQQDKLWQKTDRWDDSKVDVWFKSLLKNGNDVGLAWSHEEPITNMIKEHINSYRDLPTFVYQFQNKLRNELRAKSGILRGREFLMKDLYSFTTNEETHDKFYTGVIEAYHNVFRRVGIGELTYLTFASGGAFTQFSHEFQTVSNVGEDTIYLNRKKKIAINKEVYSPEVLDQLNVKKNDLEKGTAIETANIFDFGSIKSKELGLSYNNEDGEATFVHLGSYGIGITRLMGTLVEIFADAKGIIWPKHITPFHVHLVELGKDTTIHKSASDLYTLIIQKGYDVLWDDRDATPGAKLYDSDLLGISVRIVVSKKAGDKFEYSERGEDSRELCTEKELIKKLIAFYA
jgi:prolyl-tRNA synthetase